MKNIILMLVVAIFCACSGKGVEKAEGITFLVYPVVEGETGNRDCKDFLGRCMLFQTDKPLFQLSDFGFRAIPRESSGKHNQIELFFDEKQAAGFETIPDGYIGEGKRLALVYKGRILHAPKLKSRIKANALIIDFCNAHVYGIVLASLRGENPPGYKFNDDKAWNMCDVAAEE